MVSREDIYNPDTMLTMLSRWCDAAGIPFPAIDGRVTSSLQVPN